MSTTPPNIDRLISRYLTRCASEHEKQELHAWLRTSSDNRKVFEQLEKLWAQSSRPDDTSNMWVRDQVWAAGTEQHRSVARPKHRRVDGLYWRKIAAIVILFLLGAWFFSYLAQESTSLSPETISLVEKANPAGQRSVHRLPDGTQVWLNAESSLRYPEKFADTLRQVHLSGEAFFEVAEDRRRPFMVEAASTITQALGTAFDIHAYPEDEVVKIALLEGKVRVEGVHQLQTAILSPGQELLVSKDPSAFSQQPFSYENTFGWKEGILNFDGTDFAGFRRAIERWYGVNVEVTGTPPLDWSLRAKYQREDLRHVLRDVCFNKEISFELHDKNVLLTF